jgi:hypothetical protein
MRNRGHGVIRGVEDGMGLVILKEFSGIGRRYRYALAILI